MPYGAVCVLEEYGNKEGFVHISAVSSAWIKNIRSVLTEGQVRVALVLNVDVAKNQIDLNLRGVSEQQEKTRLEDRKRDKRFDKLFERLCKQKNWDFKKTYKETVPKLVDEFGDALSAFENAALYGKEAFKESKIAVEIVEPLVVLAKDSITLPSVVVKSNLFLSSVKGDGLLGVKTVLGKTVGVKNVSVKYLSAPKYLVEVLARDYVEAEKVLSGLSEIVLKESKKQGCEAKFERIKA